MQAAIKFIFDLEEQGRLFHFDDDPAEVTNAGKRIFTSAEVPAIRAGVALCFATMQDPFYFLVEAAKDRYAELVCFESNGRAIHNPTVSECGRYAVPPAAYGFTLWHTGGSNTAWRLDLPDGRYLLLTDSEGGAGSTHAFKQGESILLGLYDDMAEPIACSELTAGRL